MRNSCFLMCAALLMLPLCLRAQETSEDAGFDFRGRASASVDWKIRKGLHLDGGYELRMADKFGRVERNQFNIGVEWSPVKHLDVGCGYYFIGHYNSDREFKPRHRFHVDATGSFKAGKWKFSLRERLQLTRNGYEFNEYQQSPNFLELKSRLKAAYKGFTHIEPYTYVEVRNCFNGPSYSYDYNESTGKYSNCEFLGYRDAYINRIRGAIGMEWNISRHHALDFKFMTDWCHDKELDTNAKGTKIKSWYWQKEIVSTISVGYVFSF